MGKIKTIKNRIYSDYFIPSRLEEYEKIIKELSENGYEQVTFKEYKKILEIGPVQNKKYFINRHDIDTDVATAKEFFKIEKKYNAKATYYFRLSTLDFEFMKEIEEYGSEASYHFEEIAQYCKEKHIKSSKEILLQMDTIKHIFKSNFKILENRLGYKLETVCSHGDFVNRKLQITNNEIVKDKELREQLGITCETYDVEIMNSFDIYVSDRSYPIFYYPSSIFDFIGKKKIICLLSHPRQWKKNWIVNTFDNIKRVYEGMVW